MSVSFPGSADTRGRIGDARTVVKDKGFRAVGRKGRNIPTGTVRPGLERCHDRARSQRLPAYEEVPALIDFVIAVLAFLLGVAFASWKRRGDPHPGESPPTEEAPVPGRAGPVAVPVCTHTSTDLIHAVTRLYGSHQLTLIHVVEVPQDLPLEAGLPPAEQEELRAMIEELRDAAENDLGSPVRVEILHGRDPARALLDWIQRNGPEVVVLSLHAQRPDLSPTALSVLRDAQAQVWVWRGPDESVAASHE